MSFGKIRGNKTGTTAKHTAAFIATDKNFHGSKTSKLEYVMEYISDNPHVLTKNEHTIKLIAKDTEILTYILPRK